MLRGVRILFRAPASNYLKFLKIPSNMRRLVGGRFAGWNVLKFPKDRLKNAKRYGDRFEVLGGILIFSSIYRLGTKIVTGKKKQSDTKVKI